MKALPATILLFATIFCLLSSCTNYKAKLEVEVTDTTGESIEKAYVYLLTEENAREFQMGKDKEPAYYDLDSTMKNGTVKMKIKEMSPIYGMVSKRGYYYEEFLVESPLENKSKNKITIELTPVTKGR